MADIFISYAHEDIRDAQILQQILQEYGWEVWRDKRNLVPGSEFAREIKQALHTAKCVVVLWSPHSINSEWVCNEANEAEQQKKLIPVKITAVDTTPSSDRLHETDLRTWDWENRSDNEFKALFRRIEELAGLPPHNLNFCEEVQERFKNGQIVPLLGEGIYGDGPLSTGRLIEALAKEVNLSLPENEYQMLATVAEYFQANKNGDRQYILNKFSDILKIQSKQCSEQCRIPVIHETILNMPPPWLVINTNYDLLLEQQLIDKNIPFVLVSHILRSARSPKDEKNICLLKVKYHGKNKTSEAYSHANELLLDPYDYDPEKKEESEAAERRVIYKVLGSPLLQDSLDDVDWIDTMVLTETDHTTFLGMLEKEASQMPDSFANVLKENKKDRHVLFFGYALDFWHYRLVANIFSKKEIFSPVRRRPYVVRAEMPVIEKVFWERLQAEIFPLDLKSAAEVLLKLQPREKPLP